jgi:hypothetical protein
MGEIRTRVYCPECGAGVEMVLGEQQIPERLIGMVKEFNLPDLEKDTAYRGAEKCSCGKIVRATCVVGTFSGK